MTSSVWSRDGAKLILVLALALVQGLIYLFALPPWQHYDEPTHFEYAWLLANQDRLPGRGAGFEDPTLHREVAATMVESNFYWNLPRPDLLQNDRPVGIGTSELGHFPAYYLVASLPLRLVSHLDVVSQLYAARFISLLFFLATLLLVGGLMWDLTEPRHPLRWAGPLTCALIPSFADILTAVNNDVGAVFAYTLFLWGAVRLIRSRLGIVPLLWVMATVPLAMSMKSTTLVALPMAVLAILMALWVRMKWPWRWLVLGLVLPGTLAVILVLRWNDAALWYHWEQWGRMPIVNADTRRTSATAPVGTHMVALTIDAAQPVRRLMNPILPEAYPELRGGFITLGGWVWASRPAQIAGPGLIWGEQDTQRLTILEPPVAVTATPQFVSWSWQVPANLGILYYTLFGKVQTPGEGPIDLFLDGAVLVPGDYADAEAPRFDDVDATRGVWGGRPFVNLVRNGSGERAWPRLVTRVERLVYATISRSPTVILNGLVDSQRSGRLLWFVVPRHLIFAFFGRVAWGHVALAGPLWRPFFLVLALITAVGCLRWLVRSTDHPSPGRKVLVTFLALAGLVVWINTMIWPLSWMWGAKIPLPAVRYASPAIFPTALALVGGWWGLGRPRANRYTLAVLMVGLALLNMIMLSTIDSFYGALGG